MYDLLPEDICAFAALKTSSGLVVVTGVTRK